MIYVADSQTTDKTGCTLDPGCRHGIRIGKVADGSVQYFIPRPAGDPVGPEGVAVDAAGTVYGASNEGKRIDHHRLAGSGLPRDDVETGGELEHEALDEHDVSNGELDKHGWRGFKPYAPSTAVASPAAER